MPERLAVLSSIAEAVGRLTGKGEVAKPGDRLRTLVALDGAYEQARQVLIQEANHFYFEVITNQGGGREAFLAELTTLSPNELASALMVYLKFTDGFSRASWFPEVFDGIVGVLRQAGREKDAAKLGVSLWQQLEEEKDAPWLSAEAKDGIIGHLEKYVEIDFNTVEASAAIAHP